MRIAAYLCSSRHGIFYFRYPLPVHCHPTGSRGHVKISLGTREPRDARQLARILVVAAQSVLSGSKVLAMRYDELRNHMREFFGQLLREFRERSADSGPASGRDLEMLTIVQSVPNLDAEEFAAIYHPEGADGLVRSFCAKRGIAPLPEDRERLLMFE